MSDDLSSMPFMKQPFIVPQPEAVPAQNVPGLREHERLFPGQPCFYCGDPANSLDHKLPRSRGGHKGDNLVPACFRCNQMKGNQTVEEFTAKMKRILRHLAQKKVIEFGEVLQWPLAA